MNNNSKQIADFLRIDRDLVENINYVYSDGVATIEVTLSARSHSCPKCGSLNAISKGLRGKKMRHCLFMGRKTDIILLRRRLHCKDCGASFTPEDTFSPKFSKTTYETEAQAVEMLMEYNATYTSVGKALGISATSVISIFDRLVNPKRKKLPEILSIDECYGDGQFTEPYALILMDWREKTVVDVLEGRDKRTISSYLFNQTTEEERSGVAFVVGDMWEPYRDLAKRYFVKAKYVVDSFHVMENLCRALSRVRCRAQGRYGTDSLEYHFLKSSAKLLFRDDLDQLGKRHKDKKSGRWVNQWEIVREATKSDEDLAYAREYYLSYKLFNSAKAKSLESALDRIDRFRSDARAARIPELRAFMTTLSDWREEIGLSFVAYEGKRRISNGPMEGQNSQFSKLMRVANGVKNFSRFRARLMLCYNKDCAFSPLKKGAEPRKKVGKKRGKYRKKREGE